MLNRQVFNALADIVFMGLYTKRMFCPTAADAQPLLGQTVDVVLKNNSTWHGLITAISEESLTLQSHYRQAQRFAQSTHTLTAAWQDIAMLVVTQRQM